MRIYLLIILLRLSFGTVAGEPQIEKFWPAYLNTALKAEYLSDLEKEVFHELNKVRSNPKLYAEQYLEDLIPCYSGKIISFPGQEPLRTKEGVAPLIECIKELKNTDAVPILNPAFGLWKAAADHVADQKKNGGIGHISKNGATPQNRIEKYGEWNICSVEDITYGSLDAQQIVIFLLIDDGVYDRSHRKNILNKCTRFAGVAFGTHPHYQSICVIDYAGDFKSK